MTRAIRLLALTAVALLPLTACTAQSPSEGGGGDRHLTYAIATDLGTLNPYMTNSSGVSGFDQFIYGQLLQVSPDGDVFPDFAESWEADTTTATFTIREGLTCTDGSPLTPSDIAAAIEWVGNPENGSSRLGLFVQPGTTAMGDDAARTVTVNSGAPDPFLVNSVGELPLVCRTGLDDQTLLDKGEAGTGPYEMTELAAGDHYTVTLRKDYPVSTEDWSADSPAIPQTVTARVVSNESTAANLVLNGEINVATIVGADQERLESAELTAYPGFGPNTLYFNQYPGRVSEDPGVRRAMVLAMDLPQIGSALTSGKGEPQMNIHDYSGNNVCPGDTVTGNVPEQDVDEAKNLLDEAGWVPGSDGIRTKDGNRLSVIFTYISGAGQAGSAVELAQSQLKEVGVEVTPRPLAGAEINEAWASGTWDVGIGAWATKNPAQLAPYLGGTPMLDGGTNVIAATNEEFLALVEQAKQLPGTEGCELWLEADAALVKNLDFIPLVKFPAQTFVNGVTLDDGWFGPYTIRFAD